MVDSSDGGRSSESSASSSTSAPLADQSARCDGISLVAERRAAPERVHLRAPSRRRAPGGPARRSARAAERPADRARCRAARRPAAATWTRPASSAPQVTSADELPATSAMPVMAAQRGAGQRHEQQRRRPEERVPVRPPAARAPDQHADRPTPPTRSRTPAAMRRHRGRLSALGPRNSAAVGTISAEAETMSARCQLKPEPDRTRRPPAA